jgi:hypothetical protein
MLTCALRAQVKELKMEIKNKFYIESITFATFKTLNAQVPRKTFYIYLLNLYPKGHKLTFPYNLKTEHISCWITWRFGSSSH